MLVHRILLICLLDMLVFNALSSWNKHLKNANWITTKTMIRKPWLSKSLSVSISEEKWAIMSLFAYTTKITKLLTKIYYFYYYFNVINLHRYTHSFIRIAVIVFALVTCLLAFTLNILFHVGGSIFGEYFYSYKIDIAVIFNY